MGEGIDPEALGERQLRPDADGQPLEPIGARDKVGDDEGKADRMRDRSGEVQGHAPSDA